MLDRIQPGWREEILTSRYLPNMTAVPAIPTVATPRDAGPPGFRRERTAGSVPGRGLGRPARTARRHLGGERTDGRRGRDRTCLQRHVVRGASARSRAPRCLNYDTPDIRPRPAPPAGTSETAGDRSWSAEPRTIWRVSRRSVTSWDGSRAGCSVLGRCRRRPPGGVSAVVPGRSERGRVAAGVL